MKKILVVLVWNLSSGAGIAKIINELGRICINVLVKQH